MIFTELLAHYGARFLAQWETGMINDHGEDMGTINAMQHWKIKLAGFAPDALGAALNNLPPNPPTLPEFVALCQQEARRIGSHAPAFIQTPEEKARADARAKEFFVKFSSSRKIREKETV
jgi:hypothetical protein